MSRIISRAGAVFGLAGCAVAALVAATPVAEAAPQHSAVAEHCAYNINDKTEKCFSSLVEVKALAKSRHKIILGTFFKGRNYRGASWTVWGSGLCNPADGKINYNYTFPKRWRNVISSVQPWAKCKIWLYPKTHLRGHRDGPYEADTPFVGNYMNNRAESVGFS